MKTYLMKIRNQLNWIKKKLFHNLILNVSNPISWEINAFNYAYAVINKYYASCCFILKVKLNATISKKNH